MADPTRDNSGVPSLIERETTDVQVARMMTPGEKITFLIAKYESMKERTPTHEDVRKEVTGARDSIQRTIVGLAPKEGLERAEEGIERLGTIAATKESLEELRKTVEGIKPPAFWKLASGAVAFLLAISTIIWQASQRVGDIALTSAIQKMQLDALDATVKRLDADIGKLQSKLDQLLIHGAKP